MRCYQGGAGGRPTGPLEASLFVERSVCSSERFFHVGGMMGYLNGIITLRGPCKAFKAHSHLRAETDKWWRQKGPPGGGHDGVARGGKNPYVL